MNPSIEPFSIYTFSPKGLVQRADDVAVERPLEVRIKHFEKGEWRSDPLVLTMRSPGQDRAMIMGYLKAEDIISSVDDVWNQKYLSVGSDDQGTLDRIEVQLKKHIPLDRDRLGRHFISNSSCGMCGKERMENLNPSPYLLSAESLRIKATQLGRLPQLLNSTQKGFQRSGGMHAVAFFDNQGHILSHAEDVGRHNALDKLIGQRMLDYTAPFSTVGLLLSGRASYELIQKSLMVGVPMVVSIGAPSSLAIELSNENNQTLVGFLKEKSMNIYSGKERLLF